MRDEQTPTKLIDQLRSWFFAKDRSVYLSPDTFIDAPEIATPGNPATNRIRLYPKSDRYWYGLQSDGSEIPIGFNTVVSTFLQIPGLVGFWPMSSVQRSTGNAYDLTGQARTLTYNGNPVYNIYNNIVPYIALDGTGDSLTRTDETDLDILGTETIYANPGLTMGGWFRFTPVTAGRGIMSKWGTSGASGGYLLYFAAGPILQFLTEDAAGAIAGVNGPTPNSNQWYFIVARWIPSTSYYLWVNDTTYINTVGVLANIRNNALPFAIGAWGAATANYLPGNAALCFLSANALPDSLIDALYQQSRLLFGV